MSTMKLIITFIFLLLNLNAQPLQKVSLQLDWLHQFQFAGYYMAKERGYYEEEGLDLHIKEFNFKTNLLEDTLILKTNYSIGKSSLILDSLENKKIVLLAAIYQSSPMVLISLKNSKINKIEDLKNKKIMLTKDARTAASIHSMIISQKLKLSDINFKTHSFKLNDLINGTVDAMGCYLSNEPYILKEKNIKFNIHNPSDYDFDFYGGILFTSQKELKNNPKRVKSIYTATLKGWKYAFNNIEESAELIFNKYNTQNKTLDALIYEGQILKKLAKFDQGLLGNINLKKINEIKRVYRLLGLNKNNSNFKSNKLIYNTNEVNLSIKEQKYLQDNPIQLLTNSNFPPFTISTKEGLGGIEIDYWKLINKKLNSSIKFKIIEKNNTALKEIENNIHNIKYAYDTLDYNSYTNLSSTISEIKIGIATLNDKEFISDISELNGKKIAIVKYGSNYQRLKKKYPNIEYIEVSSLQVAFKLLLARKVFGLIGQIPSLSYNLTQNRLTNIKISGAFSKKFEMKLLINNQNKILLSILNKTIKSITQDEKNKIINKYYSIIYQSPVDYLSIYKIVIPLLLIILIVIITNRKLNNEVNQRKLIEEELNKVINIDSLTNIFNRRKIESLYNEEVIRARRYNRELSIIFFDIDNFKLINDQFGHAIGDEVLVKLSTIIKNNIRSTDFFGRWGGEEFIIILPETNKEKAHNVAHILKDRINSSCFNIDKKVTCSFGVSQFEETDSTDSLLIRADNAMYYVKRNGKNEVKVV